MILLRLLEGSGTPGADLPVIKRVQLMRTASRTLTFYVETTGQSDQWVGNRAISSWLVKQGRPVTGSAIAAARRRYSVAVADVTDTISRKELDKLPASGVWQRVD